MDSNSMLRGSTRFEWNHMVWFIQSHITWSAGNKMAATTIPHGIRRQLPLVQVVWFSQSQLQ